MNKYLIGIIIFIVIISTNKLSYILGCNINKILGNVYMTELFTIIVIYYSIKIFGDININNHLYHSIILYSLLKLFTKLNYTFTIICFLIIGSMLFDKMLNENDSIRKSFYKKNEKLIIEDKEKLLIGVILVGFIYNIIKKKSDFGNKFNLITFIFSKKCNNKIYI